MLSPSCMYITCGHRHLRFNSVCHRKEVGCQVTNTNVDDEGKIKFAWWRNQMKTFSALLAICAGKSSVPGEFPAQRPVTRRFHVFFHLRLNKPLSKQSWGWWFETLSRPLWRHCNGLICIWKVLSVTCNKMSAKLRLFHDDVIKWNHFPRYWPFVRGIHRSRWIPSTKASDAELWCFLWSTPEYTIE